LPSVAPWLRDVQSHWYEQSRVGCPGALSVGLDTFLTDVEHVQTIIRLNQQALLRMDQQGPLLSKDWLNTGRMVRGRWERDEETALFTRVGRFLARLLEGDLTTDASTSWGIERDERLAAQGLGRLQLIALIQRLLDGDGSTEEQATWMDQIERELGLPSGYLSDLIYYPTRSGLGAAPSAAAIVDTALAYKPIQL
jgi:hypothetical protein